MRKNKKQDATKWDDENKVVFNLRIQPSLKQAFESKCKASKTTVSKALRALMREFIDRS